MADANTPLSIIYSTYSTKNTEPGSTTYIDYNPAAYITSGETGKVYGYMLCLSGVTITSGGQVDIYRAAKSSETAKEMILADGKKTTTPKNIINVADTTITSGGILHLKRGAVASNTIINGMGDSTTAEYVEADWSFSIKDQKADPAVRASSIDATVMNGGKQHISGGYTLNTTVSSGGSQIIGSGTAKKSSWDANNRKYKYFSSTLEGIAQNTVILDGGTMQVNAGGFALNTILAADSNPAIHKTADAPEMTVNKGGTAIETQIHYGSMTVQSGGTISDTRLYQSGTLTVSKGATIADRIFAADTFTVESGANFADFELCFDLSNMIDNEKIILTEELFNAIDGDVSYSVYASPFGEETTYSIINTGEDFTDTITILNSKRDASGAEVYTYGRELILGQTVYDDMGNSYLLNVTDDKTYTITFDSNVIFKQETFSAEKTKIWGEFSPPQDYLPSTDAGSRIFGVQFEIHDPANLLTEEIEQTLINSIYGTVTIKLKNEILSVLEVNGAYIEGLCPAVADFKMEDIVYEYDLTYDTSIIDKEFTINIIINHTLLNNIDSGDDFYQKMAANSTVRPDRRFIFNTAETPEINISGEYVGFNDQIDYRCINMSTARCTSISLSAVTIDNLASDVTLTLYQATGDGSKLKQILTPTQSVVANKFGINNLLLNSGIYYLKVSAPAENYVEYQVSFNTAVFDPGQNANLNDTAAGTVYYTKDAGIFEEIEVDETEITTDSVGFGDNVDYKLLDLDEPGKFYLEMTNSNADAQLKVEVIQILNGKEKSLFSTTVKGAYEKPLTSKHFYIAPADDAEYFVKVTGTNAAKGINTNYTVNVESADLYDDAYCYDDTAADANSVKKNLQNYLVSNNYLGYGDMTDYHKFEITESGEYSFTLESVLKSGAKFTLYRLYDDGKTGTIPLQSVLSSGSPAAFNNDKNNPLYTVTTKNINLLTGTYYLQVSGGNKANDSKNTEYSIKLNGGSYKELPSSGTLNKNEIYLLELDDYMKVRSDSIKTFTFYQDNGKNKLTKVTVKANAILAPGTYYVKPSAVIDASELTFAEITSTKTLYSKDNITDDNSWKNATEITMYDTCSNQWVGYGDSVNYYKLSVAASQTGEGKFAFSFTKNSGSQNINVTLYTLKTDKNGIQSLVKVSAKFDPKTKTMTVANMLAQDYYLCVASKSAATEDKAKNASFSFSVSSETFKQLSNDNQHKTVLNKNNYAVLSLDPADGDIQYVSITGEDYTLYKNNGSGGLAAIKTYNGKVLLDSSETYYVKSSADKNKLYYKTDGIDNSKKWLGLNAPAESFEFDTFETDGGWKVFTVDIDGKSTVSASTKFNLTLYQEINGVWKKVSSASASYSASSKKETVGKLSINLAADTNYKFEISTTDNGAGNCAGYYTFEEKTFEYDITNNMFQTASIWDGEEPLEAAVSKKGDAVNFYEIGNINSFELKLDTEIDAKAAVKLTFYDENYNVVNFYNEDRKEVANLTVNSKNNDFSLASVAENIKFIRIDAAGSGINAYTLSPAEKTV